MRLLGPSASRRYFCAASFVNARSKITPSPSVRLATCVSLTNVPSFLNTWMRSFTRSHTYTRPSLAVWAQWPAAEDGEIGLSGSYGPGLASLGGLPYAPHIRLNLPLSASYT